MKEPNAPVDHGVERVAEENLAALKRYHDLVEEIAGEDRAALSAATVAVRELIALAETMGISPRN